MKGYFDNLDSSEKKLKYLLENHGEIYKADENLGNYKLLRKKSRD